MYYLYEIAMLLKNKGNNILYKVFFFHINYINIEQY